MNNSIIIDTNVFIDSCSMESDWTVECTKLVLKIHDGEFQLGVDSAGEIIDEYERNLKPYIKKNVMARVIMDMIKKETKTSGRIKSYIPIRDAKVKELIDMKFHEDDIKFVKIAPLTRHKLIISADTRSFLKDEFNIWLERNLDLIIKHPSEYRNILSIIYK